MRVGITAAALSLALLGCGDIEVAPSEAETCAPGARRCAENGEPIVEQCDESGTKFVFSEECGTGQFCDAGGCRGTPSADVQPQGGEGSCGTVPKKGCCDAKVLRYCADGAAVDVPCGAQGCGWNPETVQYECGGSAPQDPTGAHPRPCP